MRLMQSIIALDPRLFGRGRTFLLDLIEDKGPSQDTIDDLRLFATTFLGGFLFVVIYLS